MRAAEELPRIAVGRIDVTIVGGDLLQIRGEFRLLVVAFRHIAVRRHHLPPGREIVRDGRRERRRRFLDRLRRRFGRRRGLLRGFAVAQTLHPLRRLLVDIAQHLHAAIKRAPHLLLIVDPPVRPGVAHIADLLNPAARGLLPLKRRAAAVAPVAVHNRPHMIRLDHRLHPKLRIDPPVTHGVLKARPLLRRNAHQHPIGEPVAAPALRPTQRPRQPRLHRRRVDAQTLAQPLVIRAHRPTPFWLPTLSISAAQITPSWPCCAWRRRAASALISGQASASAL